MVRARAVTLRKSKESKMNATLPVVAFIGVGTMAEAMVDKAIAGGWPRERVEWIADELMEPITGTTLALTPYTCLHFDLGMSFFQAAANLRKDGKGAVHLTAAQIQSESAFSFRNAR
jgi:hypothetical protein